MAHLKDTHDLIRVLWGMLRWSLLSLSYRYCDTQYILFPMIDSQWGHGFICCFYQPHDNIFCKRRDNSRENIKVFLMLDHLSEYITCGKNLCLLLRHVTLTLAYTKHIHRNKWINNCNQSLSTHPSWFEKTLFTRLMHGRACASTSECMLTLLA